MLYLWSWFVAVGGGVWMLLDVLVKALAAVAIYHWWRDGEREVNPEPGEPSVLVGSIPEGEHDREK
jgi:hypothetical protein